MKNLERRRFKYYAVKNVSPVNHNILLCHRIFFKFQFLSVNARENRFDNLSAMIFKLRSLQLQEIKLWKNLISCQKLQRNIVPFSTFNINNSKHDKPQKELKSSLVQNAVETFKGNPYVRLMRLDKPIGKN